MMLSAEVELAKTSVTKLAKALSDRQAAPNDTITLVISDGELIEITPSAAQALLEVVNVISHGKAVVVNSIDKVMETQEAADFLNVSRPYLCKLIDAGEIPHHTVGRFRRVKYEDLIAYKSRRIARQVKAMDEITAQSQDFRLYQ